MKPSHCPPPRQSILAALLLMQALPLTALGQTTDFSPSATGGRTGIAPAAESLILAPFKYIAPSAVDSSATSGTAPAEAAQPKRKASQQRIMDLNAAGDFQAAGTEGMALLAREKTDDELQLTVANSLAWSGRLKEAVSAYQGLRTGTYADQASVGLASIYRWRGRDDQAIPLYRAVLANDPGNSNALEGLELATRETSPRTRLSFGGGKDSSDAERGSATLNHRWRDGSGTHLMEVETSLVIDTLTGVETSQQDVSLRYQNLNLALKPSLELSMPTKDDNSLYASARIKLFDDKVTLSAGRVNWGRMATNPNALAQHLSAMHAGITASRDFSFGNLLANVNFYDISDDNAILIGSLHLASAWRPLGSHFRPFVGIESRGGKFATVNYWSPDQGSGSVYAGMIGDWAGSDWNFYASGQLGLRLFGDAGTSWSVAAGGKYWVTNNLALSVNLWSLDSWRDNAAYRARTAMINLEKLWR